MLAERGRIERSIRNGYLDSSSDKSQNQLPNADILSPSSHSAIVAKELADRNPNLGQHRCKEERGSSNIELGQCERRRKVGRTRDAFCSLHPELRPTKETGGLSHGGDENGKARENVSRKGEEETASTEAVRKRLDRIEEALISLLGHEGFDLNIGFDVHMSPQTAIAAETWDSTEASFSHSTNTEDVVDQKSTETSNETDPASSSISIIPDPILGIPAPVIGMEFVSKEEAWQFYSRYAYSVGFGASRNGGSSKNGKTVRKTIRCHKGGETRGKTDKPVSERRAVKKTGCQARILLRFSPAKEVWFIHKVVLDHNHELCPEYSYKLTSHKNLPYYVKKLLEINEHSGLPLIGNINAVMQMGGGAELCGYSERDARNYVGKVRRFDLPVAPFVGVNHHGKTTVFGCSMMTCEDVDSYMWIISTFLQCMRGKAPATIITDQSKAMTLAIENCLPNTVHRFCLWHIMNKVSNKVSNKLPHDETVIKEIKSAVYDSLTIDQFESSWQNIITKSSLQEHPWLSEIYEKRSTWIPAYFKNHFWAGMSTTQRSESMNSFLDKFVNSKTTLSQFVKQFEEALAKQRRTEIELDFQCVDEFPKTFTEEAVDDQFAGAYTHKMFYKFQKELLAVIGLKFNPCERLGGRRVYTIVEKKMGKNLEYKMDSQHSSTLDDSFLAWSMARWLIPSAWHLCPASTRTERTTVRPEWISAWTWHDTGPQPPLFSERSVRMDLARPECSTDRPKQR
ncbi:hypothetical protein LUZ61_014732 [Rhynchospora tenuis]|uniref:Protein FAR1-RELATED SEQUENCE n=1 Tax=Rhynchospora tenuis TaxID=198213 RepID=A0AAD5Z207_9POAL|nr:hypothetical protein LUZ61_014732 [Rhynchospora tenuis]